MHEISPRLYQNILPKRQHQCHRRRGDQVDNRPGLPILIPRQTDGDRHHGKQHQRGSEQGHEPQCSNACLTRPDRKKSQPRRGLFLNWHRRLVRIHHEPIMTRTDRELNPPHGSRGTSRPEIKSPWGISRFPGRSCPASARDLQRNRNRSACPRIRAPYP